MATIITRSHDLNGDVLTDEDTPTTVHVDSPHGDIAFEIDLGKISYDKIVKALVPFVKVSRPVEATPVKAPKRDSESDAPQIRAWAADNPHLLPEGVTVNARGVIPKSVRDAYDARDNATQDADVTTAE